MLIKHHTTKEQTEPLPGAVQVSRPYNSLSGGLPGWQAATCPTTVG